MSLLSLGTDFTSLHAQLTEEESTQTSNNDINSSSSDKNRNNGNNNDNNNKLILWVEIKDYISTATAENIEDAIDKVSISPENTNNKDLRYTAIILSLDTPGGSLDATFDIIEAMQQSPIPIITYVYPQGTSAWSAGTIILIAGNYAAMAPFTTIGSAQPVAGSQPINDTKIINALKTKMVSIANLHERNSTQAARFVTHNDNLTPRMALRHNVINAIAEDSAALLNDKAHNSTINTLEGPMVLDTSNAEIVKHQPSLRVMLASILANPMISSILFTIGFFVLIFGFSSPGFGIEIIGVAIIILGLLGQGFDINWAAFALIAIGVGLLAYEIYSPSFGAVGIGGVAIMSLGIALMITQPVRPLLIREEQLQNMMYISILVISPFAALMGIIAYKVWESKKKRMKSGVDFTTQNDKGLAVDDISGTQEGFVLVGGEYWKAKTESHKLDIKKGDRVKIIDKKGHVLVVRKLSSQT
ncbi:MAG: nodulation protein NfeD [Nitrososphaeraceae archaeon]